MVSRRRPSLSTPSCLAMSGGVLNSRSFGSSLGGSAVAELGSRPHRGLRRPTSPIIARGTTSRTQSKRQGFPMVDTRRFLEFSYPEMLRCLLRENLPLLSSSQVDSEREFFSRGIKRVCTKYVLTLSTKSLTLPSKAWDFLINSKYHS
uniref:Uncharacterized protein n=1 Tax=Zea mays TaxID=4577 RepID=C0PCC0_MAIZE|nr:unknown [Zea mays]